MIAPDGGAAAPQAGGHSHDAASRAEAIARARRHLTIAGNIPKNSAEVLLAIVAEQQAEIAERSASREHHSPEESPALLRAELDAAKIQSDPTTTIQFAAFYALWIAAAFVIGIIIGATL